MPRRKKAKKRVLEKDEEDIEVVSITSDDVNEATASDPPELRPNVSWLESLIRNRHRFDAFIIRQLFRKMKKFRVPKNDIVDAFVRTKCPVDFVLLMNDVAVTRMLLERKKKNEISLIESTVIVETAMRSPSCLENILPVVKYGPGADDRREMYNRKMHDMINGPKANLRAARRYVERLMLSNVIEVGTMDFLETTLEFGKLNAVKMLLECKADEYIKKKTGDELLVHLFGNANEDVLSVLRGRKFNINAKCGGMAPLHFATFVKSERNVRLLLKSGADPNMRDCNGMTPLFAFGNRKCIELLLQNGADVQHVADNGYTIFDMLIGDEYWGVMLAHIALIEARGIYIKPIIRKKIASKPSFKESYEECRRQIERMSEIRIHNHFKLLPVLARKPENLARLFASEESVAAVVQECRDLDLHSYYSSIIQQNIHTAFVIYTLRCKAAKVLLPIFKAAVDFDAMIVSQIVDHLDFNALRMYV